MALLIEKNIDYQGLSLSSIYVRLEYKVAMDSASIKVNARPFANKNIYQTEGYYSHLNIKDFTPWITFLVPYDRETDGDLVLDVVHDKVKASLSTNISEERPLFYEAPGPTDPSGNLYYDPSIGDYHIDPSTGAPGWNAGDAIYDPSTGFQETGIVIIRPKFAMDSSISIVDVSLE